MQYAADHIYTPIEVGVHIYHAISVTHNNKIISGSHIISHKAIKSVG